MTDLYKSVIWLRATYSAGALLIFSGYIWVNLISKNTLNKKITMLIALVTIFFSVFSFNKNFIVLSLTSSDINNKIFSSTNGWGLFFYGVFYLSISSIIIYKIFSSWKRTSDLESKHQYKYIFTGALISLISTAFSSFILPYYFSIFLPSSIDSIGFLIFLLFIAYSITKHHLFNIKVVTIEIVTFTMWIFILIRTVIAPTTQQMLVEGGLLLITIIFGVTLIRSSLHKISQREKIEKLANDLSIAYKGISDLNEHLERKVEEQTADVRRAFEVEKKARLELEKLNVTKDHFITSTQHELRTPLTSLKWEIESLNNGTYGRLTRKHQIALNNIQESTKTLDNIIENFIKITEK